MRKRRAALAVAGADAGEAAPFLAGAVPIAVAKAAFAAVAPGDRDALFARVARSCAGVLDSDAVRARARAITSRCVFFARRVERAWS